MTRHLPGGGGRQRETRLHLANGGLGPRAQPLELTGERTLPGIWHENYWFRRHEAGYRWLAGVVEPAGRVVVEAGAGEGYGGARLARAGASLVAALDLDATALRHAGATYPALAPVRANLVALPLRDGSVEVVVSAQTLEHLWDQPRFVAECARVLRPGGLLALTTPNRATFPPGNVFHSRELDAGELTALVAPALEVTGLAGLHHDGLLLEQDRRLGGIVEAQLATTYDAWSPDLAEAVATVTVEDFTVGAVEGALDLLMVARRR